MTDLNIDDLISFHINKTTIATVTAVRPHTRFGVLEIGEVNQVLNFREKPLNDGWINGGFFVFKPQIFDFLNNDVVLEQEPLQQLAKINQLSAFKHEGFWQPMDTFRESKLLNDLWSSGNAPWKA